MTDSVPSPLVTFNLVVSQLAFDRRVLSLHQKMTIPNWLATEEFCLCLFIKLSLSPIGFRLKRSVSSSNDDFSPPTNSRTHARTKASARMLRLTHENAHGLMYIRGHARSVTRTHSRTHTLDHTRTHSFELAVGLRVCLRYE